MARRKNKKTRRARFRGINLWNAAESVIQANILTQGAFNTNPLEFMIGRWSSGYGTRDLSVSNESGLNKIGLGELLWDGSGKTAAEERAVAWQNIKNNWLPMVGMSIGTRAGFKIAKRLTSGIRRDVNKGFKMAGLSSEVRV